MKNTAMPTAIPTASSINRVMTIPATPPPLNPLAAAWLVGPPCEEELVVEGDMSSGSVVVATFSTETVMQFKF